MLGSGSDRQTHCWARQGRCRYQRVATATGTTPGLYQLGRPTAKGTILATHFCQVKWAIHISHIIIKNHVEQWYMCSRLVQLGHLASIMMYIYVACRAQRDSYTLREGCVCSACGCISATISVPSIDLIIWIPTISEQSWRICLIGALRPRMRHTYCGEERPYYVL